MNVLVFLEHDGAELLKGPIGVLGKARSLHSGVAAVLVGGGTVTALASEAGRLGATTVHVANDDGFDAPLPQPRVDVLEQVVRAGGYDTVLFSNSVLAADVAAGLAARLDAGLNWDLVDIDERNGVLTGTRLAFQDSLRVDVGWRSSTRIGLFRPGSFDPPAGDGSEPQIQMVATEMLPHSNRARIVSQSRQESEGPGVEGADVVVAGGMGLGSPEHFSLAEDLAAALGGVVGATRAVVYAGWYPRSAQIGQTGKTVSPKLYVAVGVSGAVQHRIGMQSSKTVVAINKDPNAPIFEVSDLAVVGDLHTIVPALTSLLRQRAGS